MAEQQASAFYLLCSALVTQFVNVPSDLQRSQEIQAWFANADTSTDGRAQQMTAWQTAVALLQHGFTQLLSQP